MLGSGFINPQLQPHVKALSGKGKRTALVSMMSHGAAATGTGIDRLRCTMFRRGVWVGCRRLLRLQADRNDVRRRLPDLFTMKAELGHRIRSAGSRRVLMSGSWHVGDMPTASSNVRVRGQSGKHMLGLSSSQFDPSRTWTVPSEAMQSQFFELLARIPATGCRPVLEERRKGCHVPYMAARQSHSTGP